MRRYLLKFGRSGFVAMLGLLVLASCSTTKKVTKSRETPKKVVKAEQKTVEIPAIHVVYPVDGSLQPAVDSNFIFGSVASGDSRLEINGQSVPVYKNGAFLAFLAMPSDGVFRLVSTDGDASDTAFVRYRPRPVAEQATAAAPTTMLFAEPKPGIIVRAPDTLETGSDVAPVAPTPDGAREWMLPYGATVRVSEHTGKYYKLLLDPKQDAWIADSSVRLDETPTPDPEYGRVLPSAGWVDFVFPGDYPAFLVQPNGVTVSVTLYAKTDLSQFDPTVSDAMVRSVAGQLQDSTTVFTIALKRPIWGYKAFYTTTGALDIRIRRPPVIHPDDPLRGVRIAIDAGHPPLGATGPTGLTEAEANLAIALRVRDKLEARGAKVYMTHTTLHGRVSDEHQLEELRARLEYAVNCDVDLLVSIHNNALADGVNPFMHNGTETFYYQPYSAALAQSLDQAIASVTGIPNFGAKHRSLAMCRPTWMPSSLTESLFMMIPEQEEELRNPEFLDRLAQAHVDGIVAFLRGSQL